MGNLVVFLNCFVLFVSLLLNCKSSDCEVWTDELANQFDHSLSNIIIMLLIILLWVSVTDGNWRKDIIHFWVHWTGTVAWWDMTVEKQSNFDQTQLFGTLKNIIIWCEAQNRYVMYFAVPQSPQIIYCIYSYGVKP